MTAMMSDDGGVLQSHIVAMQDANPTPSCLLTRTRGAVKTRTGRTGLDRQATLTAALVVLFASYLPSIAAESSTDPLHIQLGRAVFRVEHQETISRTGQANPDTVLKPDGTAFVVKHNGRDYQSLQKFLLFCSSWCSVYLCQGKQQR
jgi:hypothetical protein